MAQGGRKEGVADLQLIIRYGGALGFLFSTSSYLQDGPVGVTALALNRMAKHIAVQVQEQLP